jgi:hypothetical protein
VTERAWGTVREDYSPDGDAWSYLPHDHARSKAYRWGEDGIAGLCDRYQLLTFAVALCGADLLPVRQPELSRLQPASDAAAHRAVPDARRDGGVGGDRPRSRRRRVGQPARRLRPPRGAPVQQGGDGKAVHARRPGVHRHEHAEGPSRADDRHRRRRHASPLVGRHGSRDRAVALAVSLLFRNSVADASFQDGRITRRSWRRESTAGWICARAASASDTASRGPSSSSRLACSSVNASRSFE